MEFPKIRSLALALTVLAPGCESSPQRSELEPVEGQSVVTFKESQDQSVTGVRDAVKCMQLALEGRTADFIREKITLATLEDLLAKGTLDKNANEVIRYLEFSTLPECDYDPNQSSIDRLKASEEGYSRFINAAILKFDRNNDWKVDEKDLPKE